MRSPTEREITAIRAELIHQMGALDWEPNWNHVGVIDNYMPDGPSWSGKAAIFPGGEINFLNVCLFTKSGEVVVRMATAEVVI